MDNLVGDLFVPLFFISGALVMWFLAYKFMTAKGAVFKNFGAALLLYGLAFAIWSVLIITKPLDLQPLTTAGILPFAFAHLFLLRASIDKLKKANQTLVMLLGIVYLLAMFAVKYFWFPSDPSFSSNGLFYFNAQPPLMAFYIGVFAFALFPAIFAVAENMKDKVLRYVFQIGWTIAAIGGVILVTNFNDDLQTINGWLMAVAFLIMFITFSARKVR